jgi:hypothetical protein
MVHAGMGLHVYRHKLRLHLSEANVIVRRGPRPRMARLAVGAMTAVTGMSRRSMLATPTASPDAG